MLTCKAAKEKVLFRFEQGSRNELIMLILYTSTDI